MNSKSKAKISLWSALLALVLVVALACSSDEPAGPTAEEIASLVKDAVAGAPTGVSAQELQDAIAAAAPDVTEDQLTVADIQRIIDASLESDETLSEADIQRIIGSSLAGTEQAAADAASAAAAAQTAAQEAASQAAMAAAPDEKVLRFRIGQTYATFAPHAAASSGLALFYDMLYSRLLQPNPDGFFEGDIAEKWEMAADASSYTFWLDPNAKWHDGTPVTAEDVKFTYTSYVNPAAGGRKVGAYSIIKGATAFSEGTADEVSGLVIIDEHTIRIDMEEPSAIFLQTCCSLRNPILPAHIYKDVAASDLAAHPTMTGEEKPLGSGPFKFV